VARQKKNPGEAGFFERINRYRQAGRDLKDGYDWFQSIAGAKAYWLILCFLPLIAFVASSSDQQQQETWITSFL